MNDNERIAHEQEVMRQLEAFDTPTITNAVATYPALKKMCLGLYNPNQAGWYTDNRLRCFYPELGPRCGYAVTAVYGMPDASYGRLEFKDILEAIAESPGPVILALKENFLDGMKRRNALIGGNMMTAFKQVGVTAVLGDAPARDIDEMRPLGVQCLFPGVVAGHGPESVEAVNVPVSICGMDIAPREVIHMDENGAVKFPAKYLDAVLEKARLFRERDNGRQEALRKTTDPRALADIMKGIYE